jgi:hypothetical protein
MKSKQEFVSGLCRKLTRTQIVEAAKKKGVRTDETMNARKVAGKIYEVMLAVAQREIEEDMLHKLHAEVDGTDETMKRGPEEVNLKPMKKPASYTILAKNESVYDGILSERVDSKRKVVIVVTGSGQKWEFPIE